jgi:hypothetical protein
MLIYSVVHLSQVRPDESPSLFSSNQIFQKKFEINDTLNTPVQDSLRFLRKKLEQFDYSSVINGANRLLQKKEQLLKKEIIETYQLKAISHFALVEDENAERSFREILKIDSTFTLDSARISPKIISFFKQVKENYFKRISDYNEENYARIDTVYVPHIYEQKFTDRVQQAVIRSILFPGLGHLYQRGSIKAWTLTTLTAAAVGSLIYFWIDTAEKEELYIKESQAALIDYRYKKYNRSYKLRNISLIALAGIWIYTQIDLIFFSDLFEIKFKEMGFPSGKDQAGIEFKYYF